MPFEYDIYENEDFSELSGLPERLGRIRFINCRFNGLAFSDTELCGTYFDRCSFDFARLSGKIENCAFVNCTFRYANLLGTDFIDCKMTGSDLSSVSGAGFYLTGGDWSYTALSRVRIKKHRMGSVNFSNANLFDCTFESCDLTGSDFSGAMCEKLSLKNSDISGTDFTRVPLAGIDFRGCRADIGFAVMFARAHGIKI